MKQSTRVIHSIVRKIRAEEFFVKLAFIHPFFRKFVPVTSVYSGNETRVVVRDHTKFKLNISDYMQWHLFANVPDVAWLVAKQYLSEQAIVLDIGANCGHFSLKLAVYCKRINMSSVCIHAFEPNTKVFKMLEENIRLNGLSPGQVVVHPIALGSNDEIVFFDYNETNLGAGRIVSKNSKAKLKVPVRRLDDVVASMAPQKVTFIKLDVEGFEPEVFEGAWSTLSKYHPAIFFEVTPQWWMQRGHEVSVVLRKLSELGYTFLQEEDNKLRPYNEKESMAIYQYNLLAIHESN